MLHRIMAVLAAAILIAAGGAAKAADYFEDKTITVLSPVPGGSWTRPVDARFRQALAEAYSRRAEGDREEHAGRRRRQGTELPAGTRPAGRVDALSWSLGGAGIIAGDPALRYVPEELVMMGAGGLDRVTLMRTDVAPGSRNRPM